MKENPMELLKIKEAIVVEGRDDTAAVKRGVDALIIETHGFGIRKETWDLLEKADKEKGLIIFTDPDYSGEEIRRKLSARFPRASHAFLSREEAERKGDIGIENAEPEAIIEAIRKAHCTIEDGKRIFTEEDLFRERLTGSRDSGKRREMLGKALGIGYANARGLLKKLNSFGITREEFNEALSTIDN